MCRQALAPSAGKRALVRGRVGARGSVCVRACEFVSVRHTSSVRTAPPLALDRRAAGWGSGVRRAMGRVWGVRSAGFGVQGLGFKGLGVRGQGALNPITYWDSGFRIQDSRRTHARALTHARTTAQTQAAALSRTDGGTRHTATQAAGHPGGQPSPSHRPAPPPSPTPLPPSPTACSFTSTPAPP